MRTGLRVFNAARALIPRINYENHRKKPPEILRPHLSPALRVLVHRKRPRRSMAAARLLHLADSHDQAKRRPSEPARLRLRGEPTKPPGERPGDAGRAARINPGLNQGGQPMSERRLNQFVLRQVLKRAQVKHCPGCSAPLVDPGEAELCQDCMRDATWPTGNAAPAPSEPVHEPRD